MRRVDLLGAVRTASCLLVMLSIAGCGGSEEDTTSVLALDVGELVETTVTGSVGDGPITNGRVVIENSSGQVLATQRSDEQANYRIQLNSGRNDFPLLVSVADGTDIVTGDAPSFELVSAILQPEGEQIVNLNPFGTLTVKIARRMEGGLTATNIGLAYTSVKRHLGFGVDARVIGNPMFAVVDDRNAASIVRASEALGEALRRAYAASLSSGRFVDIDGVIDAISADLVDGSLDGSGADGADRRLAATLGVVSAQVALETMVNRLEVGGVVATQALDTAIQRIREGSLTVPLTGTLGITDSLLSQARLLVDAATRIDDDPALIATRVALMRLRPGQPAAQAAAELPPDVVTVLDGTIERVVLASDAELVLVTEAMREGMPPLEEPDNRLPSISGTPSLEVMEGAPYVFVPMASDADGDALTFSVSGLPRWAQFDTATGRLSGTPTEFDAGTSPAIQISVTDGFGLSTLPVFRVTVVPRFNLLPTISGTAPAGVTAGNRYEFTPTANDPDGDVMTFSVVGLPAWAAFDVDTGRVTGVPVAADVGVYNGIQISLSDGSDRASLLPFSINVSGTPNNAPTIAGVAATQAVVGNSYVFSPTASDADVDPLSFSVASPPRWAAFDAASGKLTGVPGAGDEGVYSNIVISVSDGHDTAVLPAFGIVVAPVPNATPTILGTPDGAVTAGVAYSFTPSVFDADGDVLVFSIAGRPAWASFDSTSGRLSGIPSVSDVGVYSDIRISVSDGRDTASLPAFTITVVEPPNSPPTISGQPAGSVTAGSVYSFVPTSNDPDGDALSFSITGRPAWASFSAATGSLSGAPVTTDIGIYADIRISVSDGLETATLPAFTIDVTDAPNRAPTISGIAPGAVTVGTQYSFAPMANDADGDTLTFSIGGLPGWAQFDTASGQLSGTPGLSDTGSYSGIVISVSDGQDAAALPAFTIVVSDLPNQAPLLTGSPSGIVTVNDVYSFVPTASDPDGDPLNFSIAGQPLWASFDASSGQLSGVPMAGDEGVHSAIVISVSDGKDTASLPAYSIAVNGLPNGAPTISGTPATVVTVGDGYSFTPTATDPDGDPLTYSVAGLPGWASFDASSGRLSGTPQVGDEGVYSSVVIGVSDGSDNASLPAFVITVIEPPNTPPVISGSPPGDVMAGQVYAFTPSASDADGDNLLFSITGLPAWATFDPGSGRLSGTPTDDHTGVHSNIIVTVSDGEDTASLSPFSITVNPQPNQPPTISGAPATQVTVDSSYSFRPTATDPDGDPLNFSVSGMPAWATFDTATGRLSGTPSAGEEGVYTGIRITASDGADSASLPVFSVTVNALPNTPPTISGSPATSVNVDDLYMFEPTANDADGDALSFSISGMPAWATFDTATGRLSGTPSAGEEGVHTGIRITVSDGDDNASLPAFSITVNGLPNTPPTIAGAPSPEVTIGSVYSFTPTASDADGDALTFSIVGLPGWASFDGATGRLFGAPLAGDEGTYSGIRISVSDGVDTSQLAEFAVLVVAQTAGSAQLSWDAPTENEDGTTLDDLAGFKVYYGTTPGSYPNVDDIPNPTVTTHQVDNLSPGTWYFVVTAYDLAGNESIYSDGASKIIP